MLKFSPAACAAVVCVALAPLAAMADPAPQSLPHGQKDYKAAPAGTYTLDPNHVGVIARVSHMGFSLSVFRFGDVKATLQWDPANIANDKLNATVQTASVESNVQGFSEELQGDKYLNTAKFPTATFVSTAFHKTDATHGKVDGMFTLLGKTKPVTFDVTLIGAGAGFAGGPTLGHVMGIHAEGTINPQDYGMSAFFQEPIQLAIDTEFDKPNSK
ncbi:MAG TPA: YceI family protein [Rhizomicrobium sp.]|nr:YceI family protein [Rhizomicrobium sp.]